ncbi:hypothetical protein CROQUDRAFT_51302, partial [Cronartium quercuum f. sp. fusiforme G11]
GRRGWDVDRHHVFVHRGRTSYKLGKNEVLIGAELSVLDIISAIHIMDHRMDMGLRRNQPLDEPKFDPTQTLSPAEVIAILDLSLACEVSWHTGHALSQTLLVSSYLHHLDLLKTHPQDLVRKVLRASLLGTMKCCAIVWNEIVKGNLYEVLVELDLAHHQLNDWLEDVEGYREALMERLRFRICSFDVNVSRMMASNAPPRPIQFCETFGEVKNMMIQLIDDISKVTDVVHGNRFSEWMSFFSALSRKKRLVMPFVRSILMSLFQDGDVVTLNSRRTLRWLARQCLSEFTNDRVWIKTDDEGTRYILSRLAGSLVNYLSCFSANRPRGRRMLCNSLKEWRALYDATFVTKMPISASELGALRGLIYYFSLHTNLHVFLMGFDLELYLGSEERMSMWWMIRGLTRRAEKVLRWIGGADRLEARLDLVLGDLAEAAIQRQRKLVDHATRPSTIDRTITSDRAIFERRLKSFSDLHASYGRNDLATEIGVVLKEDEFRYDEYLAFRQDDQQPEGSVDAIRDTLVGLWTQNKSCGERLGVRQLDQYIETLLKATECLMNSPKLSFDSLRISDPSTVEEDVCYAWFQVQ